MTVVARCRPRARARPRTEAPRGILDVTTLANLHVVRGSSCQRTRVRACVCVCVCKDASNINGHVVAGEASLSQFLLGEEYRRFFRRFARVAGGKNSLKVCCKPTSAL